MNRGAVLAPNWLGDAVMCLPALDALRRATPGTAWTVLARPAVAPVFALARLEMEVATLPPPRSLRLPRLRPRPRQAVIFPNSFHAALLACRLGARRRIGYARDHRGWLLAPAIPPPAPGALPGHESFYYLELLRRAGIVSALPPGPVRVALHPEAAAVARWRERLGPQTQIALHIGATFGTAKRWLPERFAELAGALAERGAGVLLVGGTAERDLAREVRMLAPHPELLKNLAGETSLPELVALLAAVDLLVANDSGPMHLAGAVGTPVVALFGSTNERETYPLTQPGKLRLLKVPGVACSPCKLRACPIDHPCMTGISVPMVLAAIEEMVCIASRRV
ncbi:MAG TPA: lipopolysaccharide heptosyltransferase II [Terriglobales bacterium]|nr:lipopolysaccharide heptosyltransferase II [Terriglobales bacterium]